MGNASNDTLPAVGDIEKEASSRQSDDMKKLEVELQDGSNPYLVDSLDADEDPKNFPFSKKVVIMIVMSVGALCSTFCSSIVCCSVCSCCQTCSRRILSGGVCRGWRSSRL